MVCARYTNRPYEEGALESTSVHVRPNPVTVGAGGELVWRQCMAAIRRELAAGVMELLT